MSVNKYTIKCPKIVSKYKKKKKTQNKSCIFSCFNRILYLLLNPESNLFPMYFSRICTLHERQEIRHVYEEFDKCIKQGEHGIIIKYTISVPHIMQSNKNSGDPTRSSTSKN